MWKIRGKTQVTILGMTLITLALILYKLSTSDVLVDSSFSRERNIQTSTLIRKLDVSNDMSALSVHSEKYSLHKGTEEHIMDDIRGKYDTHEGRQGRRLVLSQGPDFNSMNYNIKEESNLVERRQERFSGDKIVHLDLKGAPPKITYYEELFPLLRGLGATGVLLEYEDMFPYNGPLLDLPAYNAYTRSDILQILKLANASDLEVIPLIQSFGHLEFVLKLEKFSHLREVSKYPQVICPSDNNTFPLITTMIDQIMELHPHIKHLHIGCDEVYYLGYCIQCGVAMVNNKWSKSQLFLNHVVRVAKYVRKHYPRVTPLTWDDEFRKLSEAELIDSEVTKWLEPVVWKYSSDLATSLPSEVWEKYISVFPSLWIASAFKGATGPDKYITDISYHLENHRAWMDIVNTYNSRINFKGIMLTGWQRYDHFAVLCELLPVGFPSLATNLAYIQGDMKEIGQVPKYILDILKCDSPLPLSPGMGRSRCSFPGSGVLEAAERLYILEHNIDRYFSDSTVKGWFTNYNIDHSFSSPSHVERATAELDHSKMELMYIKKDMISAMKEVYDKHTIREWMSTYIVPLDTKLQNMWFAKEKLLAQNHWPKHPLDMQNSYSNDNSSNTNSIFQDIQ